MSSWLIELPTAYMMTCKGSVSAACPPGPHLGQQPCPHDTVGHSEHLPPCSPRDATVPTHPVLCS